jgi:hypothetical protein
MAGLTGRTAATVTHGQGPQRAVHDERPDLLDLGSFSS